MTGEANTEEFLKALTCLSRKYGLYISADYDGVYIATLDISKISTNSVYSGYYENGDDRTFMYWNY